MQRSLSVTVHQAPLLTELAPESEAASPFRWAEFILPSTLQLSPLLELLPACAVELATKAVAEGRAVAVCCCFVESATRAHRQLKDAGLGCEPPGR